MSAKLKPKSSVSQELVMSKVHISKSWKLPARKRVRRVKEHDEESVTGDNKRRLQNREAQRAYRERKDRHVHDLEDTIEQLQGLVKKLQKDMRSVENELKVTTISLTESERKNKALHEQIKELTQGKKCIECHKDPCHCSEQVKPTVIYSDPVLRKVINTFEPMKAVNLKRGQPSETRADTARCSSPKPANGPAECGFCSDKTACLCNASKS